MHRLGLRYQLHADLPGKPDILLKRSRVVVFVDGGFWHGRDFDRLGPQLHVRRKFWLEKISANIARDQRNTIALRKLGYKVLRFWDDDVLRAPGWCARSVFRVQASRLPKPQASIRRKRAR